MSIESERKSILQTAITQKLFSEYKLNDMVTVYLIEKNDTIDCCIYCAFIPSNYIDKTLSNPFWDLSYGTGKPGTIEHYEDDKWIAEYYRFGDDDGIEPLIINREFYGIRENYNEICEEFRLFHDLYYDYKQNQYIKIDEYGNEYIVAIVTPNCIKIRCKEIRQFLAIREMHLSIQFDCRVFSQYSLDKLNIDECNNFQRDDLKCWKMNIHDSKNSSYNSFSMLIGKKLVLPLPKSESDFYGFAEKQEKEYVEFIINADENGKNIIFSSNPNLLANNFGINPDAPNYLTPIFFKKQVLDKYYQEPSRYAISDSMLSCGTLWSLQIDNHHKDIVCVWLGDIGQSLSFEEQLYWRSFNIISNEGVSTTFFRRQILSEFTNSDRIDHLFIQSYKALQRECDIKLGWQLLLPLKFGDEYHYQNIRVPATNEQKIFDELIISITKILIDSINVNKIIELVPFNQREEIKGKSIQIFERAFYHCSIDDFDKHIVFLKKLQGLRSSSAAHRKGDRYQEITNDLGINDNGMQSVFSDILIKSVGFIDFLIVIVQDEKLKITAE